MLQWLSMIAAPLLSAGSAGDAAGPSSPRYHFMVAGHSSGGKMASDHFVAYSDVVTGLGQLESGAYARDRVPQNTTVRACAFAASPCPPPPAPARRVCALHLDAGVVCYCALVGGSLM